AGLERERELAGAAPTAPGAQHGAEQVGLGRGLGDRHGLQISTARGSGDYLSRNCRNGGSGGNVGLSEPTEEVLMIASSDRLLRRTLWANAVFSVISGAVLVAFAGPFAALATEAPLSVAGLELAIVFELLGLGVMAFGAIAGWAASRETLPRGWAR